MKHLIPVLLCFALLCGCSKKQPADDLPPTQEPESIAYEVIPILYEDRVEQPDGTLLVQFHFESPSLRALVNGKPMEDPSTPAQHDAQAKVDAFSDAFAYIASEESRADTIAMAEEQYSFMPDSFSQGMNYAEEFTYESHQMGNIISIAGMYYSYLGGAHPNTAYSSWNFDLESGKFITLPELAEDPEDFTSAVVDLMEQQAMEQFKDPTFGLGESFSLEDIYWPDYRDVMQNWADTASVFLDASGMQIVFSAYDLASYAAGPQMFTIPYTALDLYWSDAGRVTLGLST